MKQKMGLMGCLLVSVILVLSNVCAGLEIPGTACTLIPPEGWHVGPGADGAVMSITTPDKLASVSVNTVAAQSGMTPVQLLEIVLGSISESMQQDADSGWQCTQSETVKSHGIPVTIQRFHPSKDPSMGDLVMTFSLGSTHLFVLKIAVATHMRTQYESVALACAKSIKDPQIAEESTPTPSGSTEPIARGRISELHELKPFSLDQLNDVERRFMEQLRSNPTDQESLDYLATVRAAIAIRHYEQGDVKRGIDYLTNAVQVAGTFIDLLERLGDMLDDLDEPSAPYLAQSYYEDALALDPSLTACRTKLASSYMSKSAFSDARVHYEYLTDHSEDKPVDTHIQQLVLCYVSLGDEKEGITFLEKMKEEGGGPQIHIALAVLLNQTGSPRKATVVLKQVESFGHAAMTHYARTLMAEYTSTKGGN